MKILVIRFSSIGDIVLSSPVLRCLKQQLDCEVHFLTKKSYHSILEANPYLDKIHLLEKNFQTVLQALKKEKFDCLIDLHNNLRTWRVKWALRTKNYTFAKLNVEKWLLVNFKINRLPDIHIVDRYMATVQALGVQNDGQGLDYFIPSVQTVNIAEMLGQNTAFIAFAIGAAHATKRLPEAKIVAICRAISLPIILLGGPAEATTGARIATASGKHVTNTCGQLSLHQSAAVVQQAAQVITHDTGMMHIAAAFQKKIISVWGNTVPIFGMTPYYGTQEYKNISVEVANLACRPCSKIGYANCPKKHFKCMELIDIELIARNVCT